MQSEMASQISPMPRYRPNPDDHPVKASGEGWLVNHDQQKEHHQGVLEKYDGKALVSLQDGVHQVNNH